MSNITIVTAFFNIGRENISDAELARSDNQYIEYFKTWARMRNQVIIYIEPKYVDEVKKIRKSFGLGDKTIVIPVEDIFQIEPELYERMENISKNQRFCNYRYYPHAMSNQAKYDYVMLLKYWCLKDAAERGYVQDMAAWLDFGFNHGLDTYCAAEEFDYEWKYDFSDKIHVFSLKDPDKELGLRNLQLQTDCIMGAPLVAPGHLCTEFWNMVKQSMKSLFLLDCIDDDQQLLLMSYRMQPELFEVHISDWFMPLKEYGGEHLSVREKVARKTTLMEKCKNVARSFLKRTPDDRFLIRISRDMQR